MATGYAYIDMKSVLHVVSEEATARKYGRGRVAEVDFEFGGGFPIVDGEPLIVYSDGREKNGREVPQYILELMDQL